jgi:hypothetical protein
MKPFTNWSSPTPAGDLIEDAAARLREAIAILDAIDAGELLCELPDGAEAGRRHQSAVSLLAVLHRDLSALACELESASHVQDLMQRLASPRSVD